MVRNFCVTVLRVWSRTSLFEGVCRTKPVFLILRDHMHFLLSFSPKCTVEFPRSYVITSWHHWVWCLMDWCFVFFYFFKFIYFERDRDRERGRERGRERIPSRLYTVSTEPWHRVRTHETVRSWPEPKPGVRRLTDWATQAHFVLVFLSFCLFCFVFFNVIYLFSYFEGQRESGGGAAREGGTESQAGSPCW